MAFIPDLLSGGAECRPKYFTASHWTRASQCRVRGRNLLIDPWWGRAVLWQVTNLRITKMGLADDQHLVRYSSRTVHTQRSANEFSFPP